MDLLKLSTVATFGSGVLRILDKEAPDAVLGLSEEERNVRLARILDWAALLNIRVKRDLRAFIRLGFLIGPDFCRYEPFESLFISANGNMEEIFSASTVLDWDRVTIEDIVGRYLENPTIAEGGIENVNLEVNLVDLDPQHAHDVCYFGSHPDVWRLAGHASVLSPIAFMHDIDDAHANCNRERYAVNAGNCGFAGIVGLNYLNGRLELSYWIRRDQWGKGIATAAIRALWAKSRLLTHHSTVFARCSEFNLLSLGVLQKTGFVPDSDSCMRNFLCFSRRIDKP